MMNVFTKRTVVRWGASCLVGIAATLLWPWMAKSAAVSSGQSSAGEKPGKPNILLVVMDDVGYADIGTYGGEIHTPNIDSIARDGLRYVRFDTNAICSATRASLLTGCNSQTVKMDGLAAGRGGRDPRNTDPARGWMPDNVETLPQALKSDGYRTMALGKWHLSPSLEDGSAGNNLDMPAQRGFDYYYGYLGGWTDQYRPILWENNIRLPIPVYPFEYLLAADLADHAIEQIQSSQKQDPNKPWFMYLAFTQAHAPVQVPQRYIDPYDDVYKIGWDALRAERLDRQKKLGVVPQNTVLSPRNAGDDAWDSLTEQQKKVYAHFMAAYAGYLQYGDEQLGRVLAYLRRSNIAQNTIIVLISDNGPASENKGGGFYTPYADSQGPQGTTLDQMEKHLYELGSETTEPLYQRGWATAGATPFRRYKLWPYLGGVRDALIVSWPGHIKDAGGVRTQYTHVVDIAPTLVDAAGGHFEDSINSVSQIPKAGKSFLKTLADANAPSARTVQEFELRNNRAITSGDWRAVAMHMPGKPFTEDRWHLFNLADDPAEIHDLSKKNPEKLKEMQNLWQSQAQDYGVTLVDTPNRGGGGPANFPDEFLDPYNY